MESVTFTREDREKLCAHVEAADGWPAGFGLVGTRIKHEAPEENRLGPISFTAEELGDLWPKLLALASEAGCGGTIKGEGEPATAAPEPPEHPTITLDAPLRTVPGSGG